MKRNNRILLLILSLTLVFSILFTAVASARDVLGASADDDEIERGDAWEMLNSMVYDAEDLINAVGSDFTDNYRAALRRYQSHAKSLLGSTTSTTAELTAMTDDMNYLIGEQKNPANHARFGCYTVAFTNNGGWSDPIHLYNWSDDGGELSAWPGETMRGGYTNRYGQKQYYAFVPMDVPNIVISSNQLEANGEYTVVPAVRVQTVDIFVSGNTGYYLSGGRDGAKYKVAEWALKDPVYKTFDDTDPTEPPATKPTEQPTEKLTEPSTQAPTIKPTEPVTENPTVIANPVTEPSTEFNVDDYIPNYGGMLEFYEHSVEDQNQEALRNTIVTATNMSAPSNNYTPEYIEKLNRIRNFAVKVYNDTRSADHELIGAQKMLQAAIDDKSYEEIIVIMRQWFNMVESPDPAQPTVATEDAWANDPIWNHIVGDADDDGEVTVLDATRIQRVLVDFDKDKRALAERYASITGTSLSILDATAIQRYLVGFEDDYGIGIFFLPTGLKN